MPNGVEGEKIEEKQPEVEQEGIRAKLIIVLNNRGQLSINGPLQDKILCYGMLTMARDCVYEYSINQKKQQDTLIIPPIFGNVFEGNG